jgi:hypothetical protein
MTTPPSILKPFSFSPGQPEIPPLPKNSVYLTKKQNIMPDEIKPKRKVVERMDRTLIQIEPGKFVRMPQLHAKDKNLTITTKTYGSSGNLKKTKEQTKRFEEDGNNRYTSARSIKTSKYDKAGNAKKTVEVGYERKYGPTFNNYDVKKTVTRGEKVKEKKLNSIDARRLKKMDIS